MLNPNQGPDPDFEDTDDLDDADAPLPPAPLDVSSRQNLIFIEATAAFLMGKELPTAIQGLKKMEMWESILDDSTKAGLGKIRQDFAVLRAQLESPEPDGQIIALAIASLADETSKVAGATVDKKFEAPLQQLSEALLKLGSTLSK